MKLFGVSLVTLLMLLAVGYLVGAMYPSIGQGIFSKAGLKS
jgi:hypothetical protein